MKYKKTCDLVERLLLENPERVNEKTHNYNTRFLLPYGQKESTECIYKSADSDLIVYKEWNDGFLKYGAFRQDGPIFKLTYLLKDKTPLFDSGYSRGFNNLASSNELLTVEIDKCRTEKD